MVQTANGVGVVVVNGRGIWALWTRGRGAWRVRMSLDDFDSLGVHPYQRVTLRVPGEPETAIYVRGREDRPPFVWVEFAADVRRAA